MWKEFKTFAFKGNVLDMAVGVMIGGAFGKIVSSVVNDLFMPIISLLMGGLDISNWFVALDGGSYATLAEATDAGASVFAYGKFIATVVDFLIIAVCIFLFVKLFSKLLKAKAEVAQKPARLCPYCKTEIADDATRCPHCTSVLEGNKDAAV